MGIEFTRPLCVGGVISNIGINPNRYKTSFGNNSNADSFEFRTVNRFTNEVALEKMISANPNVKRILNEVGVPVRLDMENLKTLLATHATDTKNIAVGISKNLPFSLINKVDKKSLADAAYLHDLGKVLIPGEILNKQGRLDKRETEIMHRHSELGYELLKSTDIDLKILNLVRHHHQNAKKTGYPKVGNNFNADIDLQILSIADKYSALMERRSYKEPLSSKQALTIIYQDVQEGKLHPFVFKALVDYAADNIEKISDKKLV